MNSKVKKISIILIVMIIIAGVFAYTNGLFPIGSKDTHPPCNQLPSVKEATDALATHQELAEKIEAVHTDITVEVGKPCSGDETRGLVLVTYAKGKQRDAIHNILKVSEGFGVPVHLVKQ